jgi:hypothetical protein
VWFDAAAHARTLPPVGHPEHRVLVRALRGMPEPGIVANATARPPCSIAMVGGDPPGSKPFLRVQLGRIAFEIRDFAAYRSAWARSARPTTWPGTCSCPPAAPGSTPSRSPQPSTPSTPKPPTPRTLRLSQRVRHGAPGRAGHRPQRTDNSRRSAAGPGRRLPPKPAKIIGERTDPTSTPTIRCSPCPATSSINSPTLTTFAVDALARHRRAAQARDRLGRPAAAATERPAEAADAGAGDKTHDTLTARPRTPDQAPPRARPPRCPRRSTPRRRSRWARRARRSVPRRGRPGRTQRSGQSPHERRDYGQVRPGHARSWVGAAQDGDLVA